MGEVVKTATVRLKMMVTGLRQGEAPRDEAPEYVR